MASKQSHKTDSTHLSFLDSNFFPNLDWLRALSIIFVVFHHVSPVGGPIATLQKNGRYGVSLFFVVSGFLICSLLIREKRKHGSISLRSFYIRRSLRLFPLYYSMLLLYVILIALFNQFSPENQSIFWEKLPFHLMYMSNWTLEATQGPFFFSWSLAVEEQFYLIFSFAFAFLSPRKVVFAILVALIAKYLALDVFGFDRDLLAVRVIFSYSEPILMGVLAAFVVHTRMGFRILSTFSRDGILALLGVVTLALIATEELADKTEIKSQFLYMLMTALTVGVALRARIPLLGNRLFLHVGKISYGIYLLHMLFIMAIERLVSGNPIIVFPFALVGVVLGASLVYRYFERPILSFKATFSRI